MFSTPCKIRLSVDATHVAIDHLDRHPLSSRLITEPFGSYESFFLGICEKEPGKWPYFREAKLFESIVEVTKSDTAHELVS
jgi:hypothetical protein